MNCKKVPEEISKMLKDRTRFIGGSDAPVILGVSPWKSPYKLFLEKTGQITEDDLSQNERVQCGIMLEDVVAAMYTRKTGSPTRRMNNRRLNIDYGFPMVAQVDRLVTRQNKILEIKTTDSFCSDQWGEEGTDDVPLNYYSQVQHQMAVVGMKHADLAVLIGGNTLKIYHLTYHKEFVVRMLDAERTFWNQCKSNEAPEPISVDDASLRWSKAPSVPVYGTEEDGMLAAMYIELAERIDAVKAKQDEVKLELLKKLENLGDTLIVDGTAIATWKNQTSSRLDVTAIKNDLPEIARQYTKATESRVFRITKGAEQFRRPA